MTTLTIAQVKKTAVYKHIAPHLSATDKKELARMLAMIDVEKAWWELDEPVLEDAFYWYHTPQGGPYWAELYDNLCVAGAYDD